MVRFFSSLFRLSCTFVSLSAEVGVYQVVLGVPSYSMSQKAIYNKRGTVYSIPKFRGGRNGTDLILREDAMKNTPLHSRPKPQEDAFEDAVEFGWATKGAAQSQDQFGYGRRNPNVVMPGRKDKNKRNHRKK